MKEPPPVIPWSMSQQQMRELVALIKSLHEPIVLKPNPKDPWRMK